MDEALMAWIKICVFLVLVMVFLMTGAGEWMLWVTGEGVRVTLEGIQTAVSGG